MSAATSTNPDAASARLGGWQPFSACDWPGRLCAVVFLAGCPWRCGYCHNPHLLTRQAGSADWPRFLAWLSQRRGLLDGVVFSGGEPLQEPALPQLLQQVRAMGFATGLHTGGSHPPRLAAALPLLDWVGLDIKTLPPHYAALTGVAGSGQRVQHSLSLLQASGVAFECRSSIHPQWHTPRTLQRMAAWLAGRGVRHYHWQLLRPPPGATAHWQAAPPGWPDAALLADTAARFDAFSLRGG